MSRHPCRGLTTESSGRRDPGSRGTCWDRVVELRVDELHVVGLITCVGEGIVRGDEGPVSGVAKVDCHGVKVVGVHGEEDEEVRGEVKGEVEQLREKRSSWMVWRWCDKRVNGLEPCGCDVSVTKKTNIYQRAGVLRPRACCACACWCTSCTSCHCCHCPQWSSRCCCRQVVLRSHFVRELLYQEVFSLQKTRMGNREAETRTRQKIERSLFY